MATAAGPQLATATGGARDGLLHLSGAAYWLSTALVAVAAVATAAILFLPGILRGTAVMNGSARGTALVALLVAVPILVLSMLAVARGSVRALVAWLGAVAYLLYNAVLFLLATPFNSLFLLYAGMFALSTWSAVTVLHKMDVPAIAERFDPGLPARALAIYVWVIALLNAAAWLVQVVPGVLTSEPPAFLAGTGLTTNPIYAQDLSFWLPLAAVAAFWLWRRRPWGYVLVGALLTFWLMESIGVAVDQTFGHAADPASPVASAAMVPLFAVLGLVGLVPVFFYYRHLDRRRTFREEET
jgi:hypothetical protein